MDPDVGPEPGSKLFETLTVFPNDFFEKVNFEKKSAEDNKNMKTGDKNSTHVIMSEI